MYRAVAEQYVLTDGRRLYQRRACMKRQIACRKQVLVTAGVGDCKVRPSFET